MSHGKIFLFQMSGPHFSLKSNTFFSFGLIVLTKKFQKTFTRNIASVKSAFFFFTHELIKKHFTLISGSKGHRIYNRQSSQLKNNGFRVKGVGNRQSLQNFIVVILCYVQFYLARVFLMEALFL